jgi:tetratricopeptide (TPR) repeat protein
LKIAREAKLLRKSDSDSVSTRLAAERVKHWLSTEGSGRWLLIIDDANDEDLISGSKQLSGLVPESLYGSVIFTTRNKKTALKLATSQNVIPVERLGLCDASELLSSVMGCKKSVEESMDKTFELLHSLEYLPLAITQAGSYISLNSMSISGYLRDYNENEFSRIRFPSNQGCFEIQRTFNHGILPTPGPVGRTLMLSIEQIRRNDPDAADIISFMSCLGRQGIPRRLLPSTRGQSKLSSALGTLKAYCLITAIDDDQLFDMHTLVRLLMRNYLRSRRTFEHWIQQSLATISRKFSSGENETLAECELYLPHAEIVLIQGLSAKNDAARVELAHRCSVYLQMRGQGEHNSAWAINNQVLQQIVATSREEHRVTLCSMNNFAIDLLGQRKYSEAEEINRIVLSRRMSVLGSDHAHTLASMSNLSYSLQLQERYEPARDLAEEAVRMKRKILGGSHLDTLLSINNLGVLLQLQGDFEGAKKMHSEAICGRKVSLGKHHPDTLISIGNLAGTFFGQRQFAKAERMARKVYDRNIKVSGSQNPETIKSLSNLASALQFLGNYEEAEKARRQVLRLREDSLGRDHPDTRASAKKLGVLLQSRENQRVANGLTSDCPSRDGTR